MADRQVLRSRKDKDGDITALCGAGDWSPRLKADAISDIEYGRQTYHVGSGTSRVEIRVVKGSTGKYLRTDPDKTARNNLDDLPDC